MLSQTTRMPKGVTNAALWQTLGNAGIPDPTWAHVYAEDFDTYRSGDFVTTVVGSGTAAQAAYDGGALLLTTSASINDAVYMQLQQPSFLLGDGKEVFFKFEGKLGNVTTEDFYCGLLDADTTPLVPGNGVAVVKAAGAATLALQIDIGGAITSYAFPATCLLQSNVAFEIGIHIDGQNNVEAFFNPTSGPYEPSAATGRGACLRVNAATLPNVLTGPSFGLRTSSAAAKTLYADSVVAVKQ